MDTACSFIVVTLAATAVWVYAFRTRSLSFLATAMFFPGLFAILFSAARGTLPVLLGRACHIDVATAGVGVAIQAVTVALCALTARPACGWARVNTKTGGAAVHAHNAQYLQAFLRACGEELGWRGGHH